MPKEKSRLVKIHTRQTLLANEDGSGQQTGVTLYLDKTGDTSFVYLVKPFIVSALGVAEELHATSAEEAKREFENLQHRYIEWKKNSIAEPVICIYGKYYGRDLQSGHTIEEDCSFIEADRDALCIVGFSYLLAFKVNGSLHARDVRTVYVQEDGSRSRSSFDGGTPLDEVTVGHQLGFRASKAKHVMPYTKELHEKIDGICEAINRAANAVKSIVDADDVRLQLTNFGSNTIGFNPTTERTS